GRLLGVELAEFRIGLRRRVAADGLARLRPADAAAALPLRRVGRASACAAGAAAATSRLGAAFAAFATSARREGVGDPLGGAAVALELRLDPVERGAVARGPLAPIAELRQALDGGLVLLEIEPPDDGLDGIVGDRRLGRSLTPGHADRERDE